MATDSYDPTDPKKPAPKGAKFKLENMRVQEVSGVDRPANLRPFLVMKADDSAAPGTVLKSGRFVVGPGPKPSPLDGGRVEFERAMAACATAVAKSATLPQTNRSGHWPNTPPMPAVEPRRPALAALKAAGIETTWKDRLLGRDPTREHAQAQASQPKPGAVGLLRGQVAASALDDAAKTSALALVDALTAAIQAATLPDDPAIAQAQANVTSALDGVDDMGISRGLVRLEVALDTVRELGGSPAIEEQQKAARVWPIDLADDAVAKREAARRAAEPPPRPAPPAPPAPAPGWPEDIAESAVAKRDAARAAERAAPPKRRSNVDV
jgi:hypothetical protein